MCYMTLSTVQIKVEQRKFDELNTNHQNFNNYWEFKAICQSIIYKICCYSIQKTFPLKICAVHIVSVTISRTVFCNNLYHVTMVLLIHF